MTWFWFLLWLLVSAFIIGMFGWSVRILLQQKQAWRRFSDTHGLTFLSGGLLGSPTLFGPLQGFGIRVFQEEQPTPDVRGRRFVTVIEVELPAGMPTAGVVASANLQPLVDAMSLNESVAITAPDWPQQTLIRTRDESAMRAFLTEKRLKVLQSLMTLKSVTTLFLFDTDSTWLRVETPDPLHEGDRMDKVMKKLIAAAKTLAITAPQKAEPPQAAEPEQETGAPVEESAGS